MSDPIGLPVVGVRPAEGRVGSTLLMQLLATSPVVVFDRRYPCEYRFLSYFARLADQMTERFDENRHLGVTPFFFGPRPSWGPVPFQSDLIDVRQLAGPLLRSMWMTWTAQVLATHPKARFYAEKLAVPIDTLLESGIRLRIIDLVRDPRDTLASIRAFTAAGNDGFQRRADQTESDYLDAFVRRFRRQVELMVDAPSDVDRITVRYEELVRDLHGVADRIGSWLSIHLDADTVLAQQDAYRHHMTSASAAESIGRWKHDLEPTEAERIVTALGPLLQSIGYQL